MKILIYLLLVLVWVSCSTKRVVNRNSSVPIVEQGTYLSIKSFNNYSEKMKDNHTKAVSVINNLIDSECLKDEYLKLELIKTNEKSNSEVYKHLKSSNVELELIIYKPAWYSPYKSTVGYTLPNENKLWFNINFHNNYSVCSSASNIFHESTHKLGYGHDKKNNANRYKTVPYRSGEIMNKCCKVIYGTEY